MHLLRDLLSSSGWVARIRVADAERIGATLLSIGDGDDELADLAKDHLIVPKNELNVPAGSDVTLASIDFGTVQHLVSVAAGDVAHRNRMPGRLCQESLNA